MNPKIVSLIIVIISALNIYSQSSQEEEFSLKFGGYINWTANYDTRQTVNLREGYFMLYPAEEKIDNNGNDINAQSSFNFLSIQTRLNSKIEGPTALGAKTAGFVEAEFFGTSEGDVNGLRLRHAWLSLKWSNTTLLIGQTWHPMFVPEAFPQVVSFNTGVPFQPFSRNPQIRVTQILGDFTLIGALLSQRDFTSSGPAGFSSAYLRNSGIPAAHIQLQYKKPGFITGVGGDFKKLSPRIETSKKLSTNEHLTSLSGIAFVKFSSSNFSVIAEGVLGENMTDYLMLGGYGVCTIDTSTGIECYSNTNTYSLWSDISYGTDLQIGIFAGYTKNLGSDEELSVLYTRVSNINDLMRISPRVVYNAGKIKFAAEVEYTKAGYGIADNYGKVTTSKNTANTRFVISTYYTF